MAVADGLGALSRVLVGLDREESRAAPRDRCVRVPLRTPLRSKRTHPRGRYRIGSRNPRCKGGSLRGIPR